MKQSQKNYKRIVIKIGSSLFCAGDKLDSNRVGKVVSQIAALVKEGKEVVVVTSGAIALGMSALGLRTRPKELAYLQAAAAVGQHELMDVYRRFFKAENLSCGQVLLTWEDFDSHSRYLNAKNTLLTLLKLKSIPVINENDTISTDEIKFGDNDRLSAMVATLIDADLLLILSDIEGLLDAQMKVIRLVDKITPAIKALACPTSKKTCVGGMITKLEAAGIATDSGITCVIASGSKDGVITAAVDNPLSEGTSFTAKNETLSSKERWMAFGAKTKGKIIVDDGAKRALQNKKSLLAVGVVCVEGNFESSAIVSIRDKRGDEFARGKTKLSANDLDKVKGSRHDKEIIHCDDIVLL